MCVCVRAHMVADGGGKRVFLQLYGSCSIISYSFLAGWLAGWVHGRCSPRAAAIDATRPRIQSICIRPVVLGPIDAHPSSIGLSSPPSTHLLHTQRLIHKEKARTTPTLACLASPCFALLRCAVLCSALRCAALPFALPASFLRLLLLLSVALSHPSLDHSTPNIALYQPRPSPKNKHPSPPYRVQ